MSDRSAPFTMITPLRPGGGPWLRLVFWLATYLPLPRWTLLRLRLVHYARWSILSELPPGAGGRGKALSRRQLVFESDFNGTPDAYVEAFSYAFPRGLRAIWGGCEGFPGAVPVEALRGWIGRRKFETSHSYSAYPDASTKQVLAALTVGRRLREFDARTRDMDPKRFASEYEGLVSDLQCEL